MTKEIKTSDAIQNLKDKDDEANNESARTNEILAARAGGNDVDPVKASIEANDPTLSRSAYTSHKSGFNEDLQAEEAEKDVESGAKAEGQNRAVNK